MNNIIVDIYCRVSTAEQNENGYSIGEQEERLRAYCAAHGWIINDVLVDGGFSGASLNRPAIQKVIADAEKHLINKIVVYKLDRISRSQKDTLFLIEEVFLKNKVDFVSMTETLDTSTPFGLAMIGILSVFAQLERETIKERMMLGRDAHVRSGKFHGNGNEVIGYNYTNGVLTQNEYDATVVRQIYHDYANGKSQNEIMRDLNRMNWRGHNWTGAKVNRIISQPLYIGLQRWKGETYVVEDCPCIITPELYEAVQKEKARRSGSRPQTTSHASLLGGMIWCGRCGKRYHAVRCAWNGHRYFRYYCYSAQTKKQGLADDNCHNRGWGEDELNCIVINRINQLKVSLDNSAELVAERENVMADELKALSNRLKVLDSQNEKLVELFSLGVIDAATISKRVEAVKRERESIEAKIEDIKKPASSLSIDDVRNKLTTFADLVDTGDTEALKPIIHQLIKSITLTDDNVSIVWNFEA